jgi:hypothetical protein
MSLVPPPTTYMIDSRRPFSKAPLDSCHTPSEDLLLSAGIRRMAVEPGS